MEATLNEIAEDIDRPMWTKLARTPGKKEERYQHLFSGEPDPSAAAESPECISVAVNSPLSSRDARIQNLEDTVEVLQSEFDALKAAFEEFQKQFQ